MVLFIDAGTVIFSYFLHTKRCYVDCNTIDDIVSYLKMKLIHQQNVDTQEYESIVIDCDYNAVCREVHIHKEILDISDERIYLKIDANNIDKNIKDKVLNHPVYKMIGDYA